MALLVVLSILLVLDARGQPLTIVRVKRPMVQVLVQIVHLPITHGVSYLEMQERTIAKANMMKPAAAKSRTEGLAHPMHLNANV